ncbi:MAG: superoxide dismutase [bacterium]|nr:superoxide dismutase [bacterium]
MKHELSKLPYAYSALEPFIDAQTMEIHHSKHHQTYVDKLNLALEKFPELQEKTVEELLKNLEAVPAEIRNAIRNHGGGHFNHSFFWQTMAKPAFPAAALLAGPLKEALDKKFESVVNFQKTFNDSALALFGSGWTWLVLSNPSADGEGFKILNTSNQDSPISNNQKPILCVDLWEHAYYLKYQNRRAEYLENWWQIINWPQAEKNFLA